MPLFLLAFNHNHTREENVSRNQSWEISEPPLGGRTPCSRLSYTQFPEVVTSQLAAVKE